MVALYQKLLININRRTWCEKPIFIDARIFQIIVVFLTRFKKMKKLYFASLITVMGLIGLQLQAFGQKKPATRINHIAFYVVDLKKSTAFYKDALQLEIIPEPFKDGKHTWFSIGDQAHLHLIQGATKTETHDKNTHLCFSVASVDEFVKQLDKMKINYESWAGDPKTKTVRVDGIKQVYFQDPDGYWIEVNDDNK